MTTASSVATGDLVSIELKEDSIDMPHELSLFDVSEFLFNFNSLYELIRISTDRRYPRDPQGPPEPNELIREHYVRFLEDGRSAVRDGDKLMVHKLSKKSPLTLVVTLSAVPAAIGAIWAIIQIGDKMLNWRINREILELQKYKLEMELARLRDASSDPDIPAQLPTDSQVIVRGLESSATTRSPFERYWSRLKESPIKIAEIDIDFIQSKK